MHLSFIPQVYTVATFDPYGALFVKQVPLKNIFEWALEDHSNGQKIKENHASYLFKNARLHEPIIKVCATFLINSTPPIPSSVECSLNVTQWTFDEYVTLGWIGHVLLLLTRYSIPYEMCTSINLV